MAPSLGTSLVVFIAVNTMIGVGILTLPRETAREVGSAAPLAVALGGLLPLLALRGLLGLRPHARRGPVAMLRTLLGPAAGTAAALALVAYYLLVSAAVARAFGEVMVTHVYRFTPLEVIVLSMLLTAAYLVRHEVATFARTQKALFPVTTAVLAALALSSLRKVDPVNLLPLLGFGPGSLPSGALTASFAYVGAGVLYALLPHVHPAVRPWRAAALATAVTGSVYVLVTLSAVGVFGIYELQTLTWPTIELLKITEIPGKVLERLESAFLAVWVAAVFTTLGSTLLVGVRLLQELCGLARPGPLAAALVPVVYWLALSPPHFAALSRLLTALGQAGLLVEVAGPYLLLALGALRRHRPWRRGAASSP